MSTREACADTQAYMARSRIFRGMVFSREEIAQAWSAYKAHVNEIDTAIGLLLHEFGAQREASCKAACEVVAESAEKLLLSKDLHAIAVLTSSMASTFSVHLSRRPRV